MVSTNGIYNYNDTIPENMNAIFLFNGYSNAKDVLNNLINYTTGSNMLENAQSYLKTLKDNNQPYLLSLVLGANNSFQYYISTNKNYEVYNNKMILPAINFQYLYNTSGSNTTNNPNLYFYQTTDNNINPPQNAPSGYIPINYQFDNGVKSFFNTILLANNDDDIGGNIQLVNGNLEIK